VAEKTRVVIADDQKLFAGSMKIVLEGYGDRDIEVVGIAYDGAEAVALVHATRPDVVLMDVRMPVMDGVEATRLIHEALPLVRIMILTTFDDDEYVRDALSHGAVGYVLKEIQPNELVAAVKAVAAGSYLISPSVGIRLASKAARDAGSPPRELLNETFPGLSRREAEVLDLMLRSYDNHEIAGALGIAEQTVKNYTSTLYAKLGVADRLHAIRLVRRRLGRPEEPASP
jgi:DNA-binding NarL/FixJ family response regulator